MKSNDPLTPAEAAQALGVSRSRIYHLIKAKRLVAEPFGSGWLIRRGALDAVRDRTPGRPKRSD